MESSLKEASYWNGSGNSDGINLVTQRRSHISDIQSVILNPRILVFGRFKDLVTCANDLVLIMVIFNCSHSSCISSSRVFETCLVPAFGYSVNTIRAYPQFDCSSIKGFA